MLELPFASFCNRYAGQTGWVVGRGPTRFRYEDLARADGPVFFINDAVSQEKWLPENHPSFFFAHDGSMACWLYHPHLRSLPVLITDQPITGPQEAPTPGTISGRDDPRLASLRQAILYRKNGPLDRASLLEQNRADIAQSGQLHTGNATIHPLLHFAWYTGCARLKLIGCDGLPEIGYDQRLENRSQSTQRNALSIRLHQETVLSRLALPREYLGAAHHRIRMIMELRVDRAHHAQLLAGAGKIVAELRAGGCADLIVNDWVDQANGYWINGVWPGLDECVARLTSPSYLEVMRHDVEPLMGDLHANFRVAYLAIP